MLHFITLNVVNGQVVCFSSLRLATAVMEVMQDCGIQTLVTGFVNTQHGVNCLLMSDTFKLFLFQRIVLVDSVLCEHYINCALAQLQASQASTRNRKDFRVGSICVPLI